MNEDFTQPSAESGTPTQPEMSSDQEGAVQQPATQTGAERKTEQGLFQELKRATSLEEILVLGSRGLRSEKNSIHPLVLNVMAEALNEVGEPELAAQHLLKSEDVRFSNQQTEVNTNLLNRLEEVTDLLGDKLPKQLTELMAAIRNHW